MNLMPINPDFIPFFQGVRPFLGTKGKNLTDITLNFVNLISSKEGQETLKIMSNTINPTDQSIDDVSPLQYAFLLFLILILLILSSGYLMSKTSAGEERVALEEAVVPGEVITDDVIS